MPPQRREEVGHRRDVNEGHVEADARRRFAGWGISPGAHDAIEQRVLVDTIVSMLQPDSELGHDVGQGPALIGLAGHGDVGHRIGMHEGLRTVQLVERPDERLEALSFRCARTTPGGQPDPVAQTSAQREEIYLALLAHIPYTAELLRKSDQQMRAIQQSTREQLSTVLTPDQLQQLKTLRHEHGPHGPGQWQGHGQPPAPPSGF